MKRVLFVVAHPDDELLGAGATMIELVKQGCSVNVCVLSTDSPTRKDDMLSKMYLTHRELGVDKTIHGTFGCAAIEKEDRRKMVEFIEAAIMDTNADVVITHHPADLHSDHRVTSSVCQEAVRLPLRQTGYRGAINHFAYMEIPSATDFKLNDSLIGFSPNYYVPVTSLGIEKKIELLKQYENVVRPTPHPRSEQMLKAIAAVRGAACGCDYAEAFQTVFFVHQ